MNVSGTCGKLLAMAALVFALGVSPAMAAKAAPAASAKGQSWDLVIPTGVVEQAQVSPAKRITSLEGKTIALRWNGKNNGDIFLDRVAELLSQKYPSAKVLKTYKDDPSLNSITGNIVESQRVAKVLKDLKPDLVIAAQCD